MDFAKQTFNILCDLISTLIVLRIILSWFLREDLSPLMRFLVQSTDPVLKPIRKLIPIIGNLDISPLITIFLIEILRNIINTI